MPRQLVLVAAHDRKHGKPPLGLAYLAAYVRERFGDAVGVTILDHIPPDIEALAALKPSLVGVSSMTPTMGDARRFMLRVKERLGVPVILGGPHITASSDQLPDGCDVGVIGEGEGALCDLLALERFDPHALSGIPGISFRDAEGRVRLTPPRPMMADLDQPPFPAWDLLDMDHYIKDQNQFGRVFGRGLPVFSSRGCPFKCTFCSSSSFWGHRVRFHSPEYFVRQVETLHQRYGLDCIHIYDDLFAVNKKRLRRIVDLMSEQGLQDKVSFGAYGRCDCFDEEMASLLRGMNVKNVTFGIESGSDRLLATLKCGKMTTDHVRKAVRIAQAHGFTVDGSVMIGAPGETEEDMLMTLDFLKELRLDKFAFFVATPFPGTEMWDDMLRDGEVDHDIDWDLLTTGKSPDPNAHFADIIDQFPLPTKEVSKQRFMEIWHLFEVERRKLWSYDWRTGGSLNAGT